MSGDPVWKQPEEPFVLDKAENPHPRMLAGARRARARADAITTHYGSEADEAHMPVASAIAARYPAQKPAQYEEDK